MRSQAIWHAAAAAVQIRQQFVLSGTVSGGALRCAASGPYAVYLNNVFIGRGLGAEIAEVAMWETFALGAALREGENALLIFAVGAGVDDWFRAEGEIDSGDGAVRELNTGTPWEVRGVDGWQAMDGGWAYVAPVASGDWADATAVAGPEPRDWSPLAVSEEEVWAQEVAAFGEVEGGGPVDWVELPEAMQTAKCVRREALLAAGKTQAQVQTRDAGRAAYLLLDFGRVVSGSARVRVRGREGAVVDLGLARARGAVETRLRYVCKEGVQEWTFPPLVACRYMVVRVGQCPEEMEFDCVSLVERRAVVEPRGRFDTEGDDWARIGQVGARSLAVCRRAVYALDAGRPVYDWRKLYVLALNDFYATGRVDTARATLVSGAAPTDEEQARYYGFFGELVQGNLSDDALQAVDGAAHADDLWSAFFAADALWRADAGEQALALIEKEWGRLLDRPGRIWGEKAGGMDAQPGPDALLAAYMLGVRCLAGGVLEIRPQLAGRERAEGMVPTPHGDVELAWGAYGGGFSLRVAVPHDGETRLSVPRRDKRFPQVEINGETVWRNEKVHPNFLVQEFLSEEERVVMVMRKAGEYEVKVS